MRLFDELSRNQWAKLEDLKRQQESALRVAVEYAYENVPYYHDQLKRMNLHPDDFKRLKDLEKLPIITKSIMRRNFGEKYDRQVS